MYTQNLCVHHAQVENTEWVRPSPGLKLGLFAALGGGIMGYTTGKMFEEHGETENMLKSAASCSAETEQTTEGGPTEGKKKRMLRRIEEYERFEANCLKLKQLKNCQKPKKRPERSDYERSYSLPAGGALAGLEVGLTVEEKMDLWRREGEAGAQRSGAYCNRLPW